MVSTLASTFNQHFFLTKCLGCLKRSFNFVESITKMLNIDSTFPLFLKMLNCVGTVSTLRSSDICPTSVQLLLVQCVVGRTAVIDQRCCTYGRVCVLCV